MSVTSVKVGSGATELISAGASTVDRQTIYALTAGVPAKPRLIEMAGDHPAYVGEAEDARQIPLIVYFRNTSEDTRRAAWLTLAAALTSAAGLIPITWTDGGTTKRYWCAVTDAHADADWSVGTANLIAPDPIAESV